MSEQFENAMLLAMDAYKAGNEDECKNFCNQALTVNPTSANAKALKGAAVLLTFTLAGAGSDAIEAIEIWKSINNGSEVSDNFKDIVIDAAFSFRSNWFEAAKKHYEEFQNIAGAKAEFKNVKKSYGLFMDNVASFSWIQNYPKFSELTLKLVKEQIASLKEVTFAEILIDANKDKGGGLGEIAGKIEEELSKLKKRRMIKWTIISVIIAVILIYCCINGR